MSHGSALLQTLFEQRGIPRGDELQTHASDVYACLRATAYRRRGLVPAPFTARELAKFAIGHAYEMELTDTLRAAGHRVEHDPQNFVVSGFGLEVVHPDILIDDSLMLEAKTTDAMSSLEPKSSPRVGQPKPVSPQHAIQVSIAALTVAQARSLPPLRAAVIVKYAGVGEKGHEEVAHDVEPEDYREQIDHLARRVVMLTGPEMPLPDAVPPGSDVLSYDACDYCPWFQCQENPRHKEMNPL